MRIGIRLILVGVAATLFFGALSTGTSAKLFQHSTPAHQKKSCNSCHAIPTGNSFAVRGFPDVADFPGHAACFSCHQKDIFSGNMPVFCGGCHTVVGPRGKARFAFPVKSRGTQFATIFPHNVHQDIIAEKEEQQPFQNDGGVAVAHFVNAKYTTGGPAGDGKPPKFNNCAICHLTITSATTPKYGVRTPITVGEPLAAAAPDTFAPKSDFFKDMPNGHETCFNCHYQGIKPAAINCALCHRLGKSAIDENTIRRFSLKFSHEEKNDKGENVHDRDCMTCHLRIAQNADIKTMKDADVPFITCYVCHDKKYDEEAAKRADSVTKKEAVFQCTYCHASAIGRYPIPASHQIK